MKKIIFIVTTLVIGLIYANAQECRITNTIIGSHFNESFNKTALCYNNSKTTNATTDSLWLTYVPNEIGDDVQMQGIGLGNGFSWGSMFPTSMISPYAGGFITKVAFLDGGDSQFAGDYEIRIYLGGETQGETLVCQQAFHISGTAEGLVEIPLNTPIGIDGTQNVWVMYYQDGSVQYPAIAMTDILNNPNNRWIFVEGMGWYDLAAVGGSGWTWMTWAFVEYEAATYTVSATANPTDGGLVSGAGTYTQGSTCTLQATPNNGYSFVNWTKNGTQVSTNQVYSFTVTENATYVANFQQTSWSTWDGTWEPWTHGTGTEADPFLIENAQQLAYLAYRVNNGLDANGTHVSNHDYHYRLMVDIDLNGSEEFQWTPIGYWNSDTDYQCFGGYFDGNNHTVTGIYINSSANRVGLFGNVDGVTISSISVSDGTIATSGQYAGGVVGYANGINIFNCNNCANVSTAFSTSSTIGISCAGGIAGIAMTNNYDNIDNCYNNGTISSHTTGYNKNYTYAGGIVGNATTTLNFTNCYNTGSISSITQGGHVNLSNTLSGGIIGSGAHNIVNCYNVGSVSAIHSTTSYNCFSGGIAGGNSLQITNCYNIGDVSILGGGNSNSGGIKGNAGGTVNNCYFLNTCGGNNANGGQPLSSDAMQTQEFVELLNSGSCAWEYDYNNTNSGYPILTGILVTITTHNPTNITQSHATLGGVIETENTTIQSQGFEYKKTTDTDYNVVNVDGNGNIFTTLSNLAPNTSYTFRAFCTPINCGTYYGQEKTFNTQSISVTTNNATDVTQTHATLNGNLNTGDANISSQGFQYKKTTDTDYQTVAVTGSGEASTTISDLTPNTQYRFRLFCTPQGCDPVYGQEKTFNTQSISVTTNNATDVTQTHATLNGNLNIGDANITTQGFQYKKTSDIEYQTVAVTGSGDVSTTLSDLTPNTLYRFRIFCIPQGCDPIYGQELYFNTLTINVTTYPASNVTESSATLNGYISVGDAVVTGKGFRYWPTNEPQNYSTVSVSTTGGISATINNLTQNTYNYCAFVVIAGNIYQGETQEFEISWLNNDTIFVSDAEKLRWVAEQCNNGATFQGKYVKLMNDITLPLNVPNNMISIGSYPSRPFKGTFDGNGKHIYNLYIDQPNTPYQGFFGYTLNANLYNVGLVNITASGRNYTGGMVAYAKNTHLRDCYVNGGTLFALSYCGGLIGYQEQGTNSIVSGCYNTCEVTGNNYVGGLIGFSNYSTVRNSYVAGRVVAQGEPVGALIGGANEVLMYYCYFSSEMTGQTNAIGENNIGGGKDDGKDGGEGLTNAQMRNPQFVATLNQGLTVHVWKQDYASQINNGFPILQWQQGTGVEENNVAKNFASLYPNPANDFVTIQSDDPSVSLKHLEIYDVTGRKVMSETLDGQSQQFGLAKLRSGVYHIRIQTSNGCYTHLKLVVQ